MDRGDGFQLVNSDELERNGDWALVRRSLGLASFGLNLVEVGPGGEIPEHDETERDQEEVFFVVSGRVAIVIDGNEHAASTGTFARIDPERKRTVRNKGEEPARVLIISAPRSSGYEPMDWA